MKLIGNKNIRCNWQNWQKLLYGLTWIVNFDWKSREKSILTCNFIMLTELTNVRQCSAIAKLCFNELLRNLSENIFLIIFYYFWLSDGIVFIRNISLSFLFTLWWFDSKTKTVNNNSRWNNKESVFYAKASIWGGGGGGQWFLLR